MYFVFVFVFVFEMESRTAAQVGVQWRNLNSGMCILKKKTSDISASFAAKSLSIFSLGFFSSHLAVFLPGDLHLLFFLPAPSRLTFPPTVPFSPQGASEWRWQEVVLTSCGRSSRVGNREAIVSQALRPGRECSREGHVSGGPVSGRPMCGLQISPSAIRPLSSLGSGRGSEPEEAGAGDVLQAE